MATIGKSTRHVLAALTVLLTAAVSLPGPAAASIYVYPSKGQSDEQMDKDKGECHQWAVRESGWDPVNGAVVSGDKGPGLLGGAAGGCDDVEEIAVDVADFFMIDVRKKEISAIYPPDDEVSPIEHIESDHATTVVQGSESGRGWGLAIAQEAGRFSASIYGRAVGFLLYGACMPK